MLTVSAHYEKDAEPIWQQSISIEIVKVKKAKTKKATAIAKAPTQKSQKSLDIIPIAYADDGMSGGDNSNLTL